MDGKIIPYGRQFIDERDIEEVSKTLLADFLTQGPKIQEFEKAFCDFIGCKYAVAVNNATAGLHLAVLACGLKEGQRVITTPITFAASANCVRYGQGEVWFADIDPDTFLIDVKALRELIESKENGFFSGIIPVDFAGLPVNLEELRSLADEYGLWIVEDACHAPGGYFTDSSGVKQKCGNGVFAECSVFSFHPVKHIACGEGGMITTNNPEIYSKLSLLRSHGITKDDMSQNHGGWFYEMKELGFNYRLTDIQCALGITQLEKLPNSLKRRQEIADKYIKAFEGKVEYQATSPGDYNAYHLFVILANNRKALYDILRKEGIYAQIHYIPVHTLPYYQNIGYGDARLENSESYYSRCLSLPMFPTLTNEEQDFVIAKVLENYA